MATFELSEKKYKNGRRPFTAVLYELQPPECVVDDVGTKYNKNGITFLEEYCEPQLSSIKDMSVTVEFLDDERTLISGHGITGIEDDMPIFENATTIGHFTKGYISDIDINNEKKRVVIGKGYIDEMRYHAFVEQLESDLNNGITVEGSIEIYKSEGNDAIVYKNGYLEKGRIPTDFIHSGWSMVINPADTTSTLLELNEKKEKKEEKPKMEFTIDEMKNSIKEVISELNDKSKDYEAKISELNSTIETKDAEIAEKEGTISELNASVDTIKAALAKLEEDQKTWWDEREVLYKELAKAKVAEKLGEVNEALEKYSDEEKEVAKDDIEKLTGDINACEKVEELNNVASEINSIINKINGAIVDAQKKAEADAKIAEQNAQKEEKIEVEDIFSEMCELEKDKEDEDVNIF